MKRKIQQQRDLRKYRKQMTGRRRWSSGSNSEHGKNDMRKIESLLWSKLVKAIFAFT
jgi:hypothetical protein